MILGIDLLFTFFNIILVTVVTVVAFINTIKTNFDLNFINNKLLNSMDTQKHGKK